MDPMEIDATLSAAPAPQRSHTHPTRPSSPPGRPSLAKRVSFEVPQRSEDRKRQRTSSPAPPVQPADTPISPAATPGPPSVNLLPSIFHPFHGVPTPTSSTPLTREATLVQTIDNLSAQKKATKRLQIYLTLQERDRIIADERAKGRAAAEGGGDEASREVTEEELSAVRARLEARPDPKKPNREFEYRGGEWIRDPVEREKWKRPKGEELGHGAAERVLLLTAEVAAKMKVFETQSNAVLEGKKRALESERKRMGALDGTGGEGSGATTSS